MVLNPDLLPPSLKFCPLPLRKQELSLRVLSLGHVYTAGVTTLWGVNGVCFAAWARGVCIRNISWWMMKVGWEYGVRSSLSDPHLTCAPWAHLSSQSCFSSWNAKHSVPGALPSLGRIKCDIQFQINPHWNSFAEGWRLFTYLFYLIFWNLETTLRIWLWILHKRYMSKISFVFIIYIHNNYNNMASFYLFKVCFVF